jgi:Uncharacterized protein conserved in bacteria (DUF2169)
MGASTLVLSARLPGMGPCLALIANRAYRIQLGGRASPLADVVPVTTEPLYAPSSNEGAGRVLVEDAHAASMGKVFTDVLVRGTARSRRGPVTTLETGVRVGAARKAVRAVGDRRIVLGAGGALGFSAADPFVEMPLIWDRAYGGRDHHAEALFAKHERPRFAAPPELGRMGALAVYPRNGAGRGYGYDIERARFAGAAAPNLEDPTDAVTPDRLLSATTNDWIDRPAAACYAPIDAFTFPRAAFLIPPAFDPPTRPVHEVGAAALTREDLERQFDLRNLTDRRMFNSAPAGLAVCRLEGGERVSLWNMHHLHELLEFDLPGDRPKLVLEPPGVAPRELPPMLGTVLIEPDEGRVTLTWAGVLPVAVPYPEEMTATMPHVVVWRQ